MSSRQSRKVFFVIGEESGDALGADLIDSLKARAAASDVHLDLVGIAGKRMSERGIHSLFDISDIAVMGIVDVLARLPKIIKRVRDTVAAVQREKPDILVIIDSPDFTHAVAKRVRRKMPDIPVIDYVCPSVWAWRQGRARKMTAYIDHVLALLPFEPAALERLNGPPATYVGHRLVDEMKELLPVNDAKNGLINSGSTPVLLVLPGSRKGELKRLLDTLGETIAFIYGRGARFRCIIPAVSHLAAEIEERTSDWAVKPEIFVGEDKKLEAFRVATAALAVSGTISLELALAGIPMVLAYKLDAIARPFGFLITTWSAALPNLIADYVVVPEEVNETASKGRLGRHVERLLANTPERLAQVEGLKIVSRKMQVDLPPGEKAAEIVLKYIIDKN